VSDWISPCANAADNCCYFSGVECPHLEVNTVEGRHWVCGLRRRLGSWDAVYASAEWQRDVLPRAIACGLTEHYRCDRWPPPGEVCASCGMTGT
jgi:hypothetical protein